MILKSFQILAICTSMAVTPSNFHYDQIKKTNETYTLNVEVSKVSDNTVWDNTKAYNATRMEKFHGSNHNNQLLVNTTTYLETNYYNSNGTITSGYYNNIDQEQNSMLTVMQIAPYQSTTNNRTLLQFVIAQWLNPGHDHLTLYTEVYTSTESYWNKYVDSSLNSRYFNYNVLNDITDGTKGFIYSKDVYQQTINQTGSQQYSGKTINSYIDWSKTTYIYIYQYMLSYQEQGSQGTGIEVTSTSEFMRPFVNESASFITITGEVVPQVSSYEVIDIPGIMFDVLTMPFTFISVAFNLTLFPNTPYQINISNLFLSIIGALVFMLIIRKLLNK